MVEGSPVIERVIGEKEPAGRGQGFEERNGNSREEGNIPGGTKKNEAKVSRGN